MGKYLPLSLATAAIVATQIACTFFVVNNESVDEVFADHAQQVYFDGDTVRVDLGRKWLDGGELPEPGDLESGTVVRLVLTPNAVFELHAHLTNVASAVRQKPSSL